MKDIILLKFLFKESFSALEEALIDIDKYERVEVEEAVTSKEAATILASFSGGGIIIASLKSEEDMNEIDSFIRKESRIMTSPSFRFAVIPFSQNKEFSKKLSKLNVKELFEPEMSSKTLRTKINLWLGYFLGKEQKENSLKKLLNPSVSEEKPEKNKRRDYTLEWKPPMETDDDLWIIKDEDDIKLVLSSWTVLVTGPSLAVVRWRKEKERLWRLDFEDTESDMNSDENGCWYFEGDQVPEFRWSERRWFFKGAQFRLFFKGSDFNVTRFSFNSDKTAEICENSMSALSKERYFIDSLNIGSGKKEISNLDEDSPDLLKELPSVNEIKYGKVSTFYLDVEFKILSGENIINAFFYDFFDKTLVLSLNKEIYDLEEMIKLKICFKSTHRNGEFEIKGLINKIDNSQQKKQFVMVDIDDENKDFESLISLYQESKKYLVNVFDNLKDF